jgi:DNA-directed RNA polymerase specialized sigma24 family protein
VRTVLPALIFYDGPTPVRIVVRLSREEAERAEGWLEGSGGVEGRVRIADRMLVVPRGLYDVPRLRANNRWVVTRLRTRLVVRASRHGLPAVDLEPDGFAILNPCLCGIEGEFPAVLLRGRRQLNPRLVVRLTERTQQPFHVPPDPEHLRAVVRRAVRRITLPHADREELEQELWVRAWERAQERRVSAAWVKGAALNAVRRPSGLLSSAGRDAEDLDGRDGFATRLGTSEPWPSPSLVEFHDLLERELLPAERRFIVLLASGYTPQEGADAVGLRDGDALLARVRAIVARALDEAGQPPLRPSERWARDHDQFLALPAAA